MSKNLANNGTESFRLLLAGKAVFTVSSPSGERYTYRISQAREPNARGERPYFVGVLAGPDNGSDYSYLGMLRNEHEVARTRASRVADDATSFRVIRWTLRRLAAGDGLPEGYEVRHAGRCMRCGRTLTVPESIDTGLGPECASKF